MENINNSMYLLFLKQEQAIRQAQARNINNQLSKESEAQQQEFNQQQKELQQKQNSFVEQGDKFEDMQEYLAMQNQLNLDTDLLDTTNEILRSSKKNEE